MLNFQDAVLLLIDMQNDAVAGVPEAETILRRAAQVAAACRRRGIPVVYSRHVYSADGTDLAFLEPTDASGRPALYVAGTEGAAIHPLVEPAPGDPVVDKQRWSAFFGSKLDVVLRRLRRDTLIVGGFVTDGCVLNTVYDAYYRDYRIVLVKDMAGASSEFVHSAAVVNMANWVYGIEILTSAELLKALADEPYRSWRWSEPEALHPTADTLLSLYHSLGES